MKEKGRLESQLKLLKIIAVQIAIYGNEAWIVRIMRQGYRQQR